MSDPISSVIYFQGINKIQSDLQTKESSVRICFVWHVDVGATRDQISSLRGLKEQEATYCLERGDGREPEE